MSVGIDKAQKKERKKTRSIYLGMGGEAKLDQVPQCESYQLPEHVQLTRVILISRVQPH